MNFRIIYNCLLAIVVFTATAFAAEPQLTLYVPFDGSINAKIADGNPQGTFGIKDKAPQFTDGISGKGFLTGAPNQSVQFDAKGNISPSQWTITFWMKGLPGAKWNSGKFLQGFWSLYGEQGAKMWLYRYSNQNAPWLYSRPEKGKGDSQTLLAPAVPEEEWHYWAVSWHKGSGAYLYLDGQLVGQSQCQPPEPVRHIIIGQPVNPSVQNKIIDEFKIYDTALDSGAIAQRYWQEGNMALQPKMTVAPAQQKIKIDGKIDPREWQHTAGFTRLIDAKAWDSSSPQTWGRITYDDQYLYVAMRSDNLQGAKNDPDNTVLDGFVKKDAVKRDGDVKSDDSFFLQLMPNPANKILYSIAINSIDTIYDAVSEVAKKENPSWDSAAHVKSVENQDGWSMEAAIPLKDLGINKINDGAIWRINFGRIWKLLLQRTDVWAPGERIPGKSFSRENGLGIIEFSSQANAVVDLQQFDIKPAGSISAQLSISNPSREEHQIEVLLQVAGKTLESKKVLLQPGQKQDIDVSGLPHNANGALAEILVKDGTKVLFRQAQPIPWKCK